MAVGARDKLDRELVKKYSKLKMDNPETTKLVDSQKMLSRAHMWDGALFPHRITYRYTVDGREYPGKRIISPYAACPRTGDSVQVCYDARYPERSALITQPEDDH